MPNRNADRKPSTAKPGTIDAASMTRRPLITSTKSPRVMIEIGNVSMTSIGRRKTFITPSTTATINAATNPSTCTPGKTYALINIARAETTQCIIVFIIHIV